MDRNERESYASNKQRAQALDARTERIRALNDVLRRTFTGGRLMITPGIRERADLEAILHAVAAFDSFSGDNDPHGEHDFGAIDIGGARVFWKIDCYDKTLEYGSPDPADPDVTARVLTIMLAEEY